MITDRQQAQIFLAIQESKTITDKDKFILTEKMVYLFKNKEKVVYQPCLCKCHEPIIDYPYNPHPPWQIPGTFYCSDGIPNNHPR